MMKCVDAKMGSGPRDQTPPFRTCMRMLCLAVPLIVAACGEKAAPAPTETLAARAWVETLEVDGEIKAAAATGLTVPGGQWENRALLTVLEDGSRVKTGDVIARFDAPRARMELSQAELELLRKELLEQTQTATTDLNGAQLSADTAKVNSDLELSTRYAGIKAESGVLTRNQVLDALQDTGFLTNKRSYLGWKGGQAATRDAAERAVIVSQKNSVSLTAEQRRKSLNSLELTAPHDGVFLMAAKWDGSKPQIGASMWSGQEFGSLPDVRQLLAKFSVPEGEAFGLKVGQAVRARLAGTGVEFELKISKVGGNASTRSRESPVKYSEFEAAIAPEVASKLGLGPGQAVHASVRMVDRPSALTVPNLALEQNGASYAVYVGDAAPGVKQVVELGQRGAVRSEIKSGVAAGAHVLLLPPNAGPKGDKNKEVKKT